MLYIPDAYDQWKAHDAEQQAELDRLPKCSECGYPIQEEYCWEMNGEYICERCLKDNHRVSTEDVI